MEVERLKAHHYGILFTILALAIFTILDIKTSNVKAIIDERNKMNTSLTSAIDDGVNALARSYTKRSLIGSKDDGVSTFLISLYASLGLTSDPVAQQKLRLYIPVIALTDQNGLSIFFNDEYETSGITSIAMRWSERYPYAYEDEDFIYNFNLDDTVQIYDKNHIITANDDDAYIELDYHEFQTAGKYATFRNTHAGHFLLNDEEYYLVRKSVIITTINEKLAYYINKHNNIAAQYGISYNFSLPTIDESELLRSIEQPGMIVVFQGYPIHSTKETYNRVAIAGAQIYRDEIYYLEEKGWYKVYHVSTCTEVKTNPNIDQTTVYYTVEDCVKQGAYGCEKCTDGVNVPEYYIR